MKISFETLITKSGIEQGFKSPLKAAQIAAMIGGKVWDKGGKTRIYTPTKGVYLVEEKLPADYSWAWILKGAGCDRTDDANDLLAGWIAGAESIAQAESEKAAKKAAKKPSAKAAAKAAAMKIAKDSNFQVATRATWQLTETAKGKPDYKSASGSAYWYSEDGVVRMSDHWNGRIANCQWWLDVDYSNGGQSTVCETTEVLFGFCAWADFKPIQ